MARAKIGSIVTYSTGDVKTVKGKSVPKYINFRGRRYTLVGAVGMKKQAERMATGYRRQFGGALVRRLEPGNFGIYAGGSFGK